MSLKKLAAMKKCLLLVSNYSSNSKYFTDSNKLVIGKTKDGTGEVAGEESAGLKAKTLVNTKKQIV